MAGRFRLGASSEAESRTTFGGDPQGTGWNRTENEPTPKNVKDLKLEWILKLDSPPKELTGLAAARAGNVGYPAPGLRTWW